MTDLHLRQFENLRQNAVLKTELRQQEEAMRQRAFQKEMEQGAREQHLHAEAQALHHQGEARIMNVERQAEMAVEHERQRLLQQYQPH